MAALRAHFRRSVARTLALILFTAGMAPVLFLRAQDGQREYAVKAVFLYNFCQFMDWPSGTFSGPRDPIVIGVLGGNPFGSLLNDAVAGEQVRGRSIRVEYYRNASEARCNILFVPASETERVARDLPRLHQRGIATVGESEAFLDAGGMIALIPMQNRVHLKVNLPIARSSRIELSSKLLRVADVYR
jgi:hypothetical protein